MTHESENRNVKSDGGYGRIWDKYVREAFPKIQAAPPHSERELESWRVLNKTDSCYEWPGDEWGDRYTAQQILDRCLVSHLHQEPAVLCEIGAGAGRYTVLAFERFKNTTIHSFDVSRAFQQEIELRCKQHVEENRLNTHLLDKGPAQFARTLERLDLLGSVDAIYSYDAMVHVDLHSLLIYWLTAAKALRTGGILTMSVADATTESGFTKLMHDAPSVFNLRGGSGGHFMWISRDIVDSILTRLGFEIEYSYENGRDLFFSAKLLDHNASAEWLKKSGKDWLEKK